MTLDLKLLAASSVLTLAMLLFASNLRVRGWTPEGMKLALGNRENLPEPSPVAARAERAARNMLEAMVMFTAVVLAAHAGGVHNERVDLGAMLFFGARVVYWPVLVAGIVGLRTAVWGVGVAGTLLIAAEVLRA